MIKLYDMSAAEFMQGAETSLLPFAAVMKGYEQAVWEADKRIYASELPSEEKATLLTAMAILAGLKDKQLTLRLIERRRDLMIESYGYEIIKQEGLEEGLQQGIKQGMQQGLQQGQMTSARKAIFSVLKARFTVAPFSLVTAIENVQNLKGLEDLLTAAVKAATIEEFHVMLTQILESTTLGNNL